MAVIIWYLVLISKKNVYLCVWERERESETITVARIDRT